MPPNNPMTEGEALAVDVGALHDAAKFLAGRYSDHDGWVVAIRAAASALTAHTAASGGEVACYRWLRNGEPTQAGWIAGVPSERQFEAQRQCKDIADWTVEYAYTAPPAAVPADALERLVEKWRETADGWYGDDFNRGRQAAGMKCADELAALIPKGADHEQH